MTLTRQPGRQLDVGLAAQRRRRAVVDDVAQDEVGAPALFLVVFQVLFAGQRGRALGRREPSFLVSFERVPPEAPQSASF